MEVAKQATLTRHGHLNTKYYNLLIRELPRHERNEIDYDLICKNSPRWCLPSCISVGSQWPSFI